MLSNFGNRTLPIRIIPVGPGAAQRRTIAGSSCGTVCNAGAGYGYVTGLASLRANALIPAFKNLP